MRLATVRTPDGTRCVRLDDDEAVETGHRCVRTLLQQPDWRDVARSADGPRHPIADADWAPVVPYPDKIMCVGLNYRDHIAETGRPAPSHPTLFPKFAGTLIGANDEIVLPLPGESTSIDWEAELGIVIGSAVRRADAHEAAAAIAGYTVVNDISVRDFQNHTPQFMPGKAWESTTPVGPWLVTAEPGEPAHFPISCEVDGEVMQSSNTDQLLFDPAALIRYASTFITLLPGDLISTGTPGGVGAARTPPVWLRPGQTVVTRIDGVGECRNVCV